MADNIKDQIIDNYLKLFINDFNDTKIFLMKKIVILFIKTYHILRRNNNI